MIDLLILNLARSSKIWFSRMAIASARESATTFDLVTLQEAGNGLLAGLRSISSVQAWQ
jgi:hypothetical protein